MSLAVVHTRAQLGLDAPRIQVEVLTAGGLPAFQIVGLPEAAVRESRDRVRGALQRCGFQMPDGRITVNLAPADLPKVGARFDLPIALGVLAASGQIPPDSLQGYCFAGELALSGALRPIHGALSLVQHAHVAGEKILLPADNAEEAGLLADAEVYAADHLLSVTAHLRGQALLARVPPVSLSHAVTAAMTDLRQVRGQAHARRALEIAAAGGHNLLMLGPPGTGKTLLASCLPGILPPLTADESMEVAAIQSISDEGVDVRYWGQRPYRAPHHTASSIALIGGGAQPRPGEISLAHRGVLFLDELPEFPRHTLEVLREPLESERAVIARAKQSATYPAAFQLVAAMNPCPCGYLGDPSGKCHCTPEAIARYRGRISGPLLDRMDLHIEVPRVPHAELLKANSAGEDSATVRARVFAARTLQLKRSGVANARLNPEQLEAVAQLDGEGRALVQRAMERFHLSARAYHRILRVARSISDLMALQKEEEPATVLPLAALHEALGFRALDRGSA
jgi:magnesium chelatase family protein